MADSIDVHDLPKEQVKFVEQLVAFLRKTTQRPRTHQGTTENDDGKNKFETGKLGVRGTLSRSEIYDNI